MEPLAHFPLQFCHFASLSPSAFPPFLPLLELCTYIDPFLAVCAYLMCLPLLTEYVRVPIIPSSVSHYREVMHTTLQSGSYPWSDTPVS